MADRGREPFEVYLTEVPHPDARRRLQRAVDLVLAAARLAAEVAATPIRPPMSVAFGRANLRGGGLRLRGYAKLAPLLIAGPPAVLTVPWPPTATDVWPIPRDTPPIALAGYSTTWSSWPRSGRRRGRDRGTGPKTKDFQEP